MGSGGSKDGKKGGKGGNGNGQPTFAVEGVKMKKVDAKEKKVDVKNVTNTQLPKKNVDKTSKSTAYHDAHKINPVKQAAPVATEEKRSKEELEQLSIEQQMAQQYKQFEAKRMLEESKEAQEELSLEQVAAQQYKAYEDQQKTQKKLAEQEEMSLEQQAIQQYKAFAAAQEPSLDRQNSMQKALLEADSLLDAYAPPVAKVKKEGQIHFFPDSGTQEERNSISCIVPGKLYLTNFRGVERMEELESLGVRHIVCVNEQENEFAHKFNYFNIDSLEDQEDHDAMQHFASVAQFTDRALAEGGAVCFHCAAGISRSSTMMISYLMTSRRLSLLDAFALTYKARRVTWPNRTFMQQLIEYEFQLQLKGLLQGKGPSLTLEQWDLWTCGDEEQHRASKEACLQDRSASLRGKESIQFLAFKDALQKELSLK